MDEAASAAEIDTETDTLKGGTVDFSGQTTGGWRFDGGEGTVDPATVDDLMILLRYTVAMN